MKNSLGMNVQLLSTVLCSTELSTLMKEVPYVTDVHVVPCVWEINKFLKPFLRTIHDFANVHHFWLHKNIEGIYRIDICIDKYL